MICKSLQNRMFSLIMETIYKECEVEDDGRKNYG